MVRPAFPADRRIFAPRDGAVGGEGTNDLFSSL